MEDKGARSPGATRALRVGRPTARPMAAEGGASTWAALRVRRAKPTFALHTVGAEGARTRTGARRLPGGGRGCASGMAVGSDAGWRVAVEARRGRPDSASPTGAAGGASPRGAPRAPRGAPSSARPTAGGSDACLPGAPKVQRGARHSARRTEAGSGACSMEAVSVPRASTVGQTFAWLMAAGSGARCLGAPRVPAAGPTAASGTAGGSGVRSRGAGRVPRGVPTFVRLMGVGSDAVGRVEVGSVRSSPAGGAACVRLIAIWFRRDKVTPSEEA